MFGKCCLSSVNGVLTVAWGVSGLVDLSTCMSLKHVFLKNLFLSGISLKHVFPKTIISLEQEWVLYRF